MSSQPDLQTLKATARRRHLAVTGGLLALSAAAYLTVVVATLGNLPDTMATHFNLHGVPDGFMSTTAALLFQGGALILIPGALVITMTAGQWWRGTSARLVSATVAGLTVGLSVLFTVLTLAHVGVADPSEVRLTITAGLLALGAAALSATAAAMILPKALPQPETLPIEPVPLGKTDRASWFGTASSSQGAYLLIGAAILVLSIAAIATATHWIWLLAAFTLLLALGATSFSVTVDRRGLRWKAAPGFPRGTVALAAISDVHIITVNPGDFGGYGLRYLPGRFGLITRSGEALSVQHQRGELVITVDEAATAAAVLKGMLLARSREAASPEAPISS